MLAAVVVTETQTYTTSRSTSCWRTVLPGIDIDRVGGQMLEAYPDAARRAARPVRRRRRQRGGSPTSRCTSDCSGAGPGRIPVSLVEMHRPAAGEPVQAYGTLLSWAVHPRNRNHKLQSQQLLAALLRAYPQAANQPDSAQSNRYPLHYCLDHGDQAPVAVIEAMARAAPGALLQPDHRGGNTPLLLACKQLDRNLSEVAALLIELESRAVKIADKDGNLALHAVCARPRPAPNVLTMLIDIHPRA